MLRVRLAGVPFVGNARVCERTIGETARAQYEEPGGAGKERVCPRIMTIL